MSRIYELYVADERDAREICEDPNCVIKEIWVPGFDEARQLSLLSLFLEIPPTSLKYLSFEFYDLYHTHFELLHPTSEVGAECYVAKFPNDLVRALAALDDAAISDVADKWLAIEPSFAKGEWTKQDVEDLLKKVCITCKIATDQRKLVLFRCSL